jgi:hypothetical protein
MPQGVTSASLIVIILVAAAVGAAVGGLLGQTDIDHVFLAIIAGFCATVSAVIARNALVNRISGAGPDDTRIPVVVAVFALASSLAGSLAANEILDGYPDLYSSGVWLGTFAGLVSSIIMAMLMITFYMNPRPQG